MNGTMNSNGWRIGMGFFETGRLTGHGRTLFAALGCLGAPATLAFAAIGAGFLVNDVTCRPSCPLPADQPLGHLQGPRDPRRRTSAAARQRGRAAASGGNLCRGVAGYDASRAADRSQYLEHGSAGGARPLSGPARPPELRWSAQLTRRRS